LVEVGQVGKEFGNRPAKFGGVGEDFDLQTNSRGLGQVGSELVKTLCQLEAIDGVNPVK
jgi:hypothetical protein